MLSVPPQAHSFTNVVIGISLCLEKEGGSSVCLRYCLELKMGLYFYEIMVSIEVVLLKCVLEASIKQVCN